MCYRWGFLLLFASNALAGAVFNSSNSFSPSRRTTSLERQISGSSDSSVNQDEPTTCFGRIGRSFSIQKRLHRRSIMKARTLAEPSSPTAKLDTIAFAEYHGYGAERHSVVTEDGYVLEVHRIYNSAVGQNGTGTQAKPVVVIQHGFAMDSKCFLVLGPGKALGYFLADAGYDVWLSNLRGNIYSRKHTTLSTESQEFWDFSYTEVGMHDLPAVINYALEVTGRKKLHYIGHSMGTLSFLIMGSKRPEMLSKVQTFTALAPLTTVTEGRSSLLQMTMYNYKTIAAAFEQAGVYEFLSKNQKVVGIPLCSDNWYSKNVCSALIISFAGKNPFFDKAILGDILAHFPSGTSIKTFRHFGQNYFNGFREYDYGAKENIAKYNNEEPPIFDFSKMEVPTQLYFGIKDVVADSKGAKEICKILPNVFRCEAVDDRQFGHGDFIWATNALSLVYERVLTGLRRFERDSHEE